MGTIYILKHKDSKFSGYQLGVGFHKGRGSTSSKRDVDVLVEKGLCKDITNAVLVGRKKAEEKKVKKEKAETLKKVREEKKAKDEAKKKSKEEAKKEEEPKTEEKK